VTFTGTGFAALRSYAVQWNTSVTLCSGITDDHGGLLCAQVSIPAVPGGLYPVSATAGSSVASTEFSVIASLSLSLTTGGVGTSLLASGSGFDASAPYALTWNSTVTLCSEMTVSDGGFACSFTVPIAPGGSHTIVATQGANFALAEFTVVASLQVSNTFGSVGTSVTVTGTGFDPSSPYTLTWEPAVVPCSGPTDVQGSFACTFSVPSTAAGAHRIVVTEGINVISVDFSVTANLVLNPSQGPVGAAVIALGTGFGATSPYTVLWNDTATLCSGVTGSQGSFACPFLLPSEPSGQGTISAVQGSNQAGTSFVVTTAFSLATASGTVGSILNVTGTGFVDTSPYSVVWNSSTIACSGVTGATGGFNCSYSVPDSPAGLHTVTAVQGALSVGAAFFVVPSLSLSPTNGRVGTVVTVSGEGFDAGSDFLVLWNSTTTLCAGSTGTNGQFSCTFDVPSSIAGSNTLTVSEGAHTPTVSFAVSVAPPGSSGGGSTFPWWELVVIIALVIAVLLVIGLLYERRYHRYGPTASHGHRSAAVESWNQSPAPIPAPPVGATADIASAADIGAFVPPVAEGEPEDIDVLIGRLERMSIQMFKKTPKELGDHRAVGEMVESARDP
jgi:hypothetical protein